MKLLGSEVIQENVKGEDVLDGVDGGVLGKQVRHAGVVDGAYCDGGAAVDLCGEVGKGEVMVEGGEVRVGGEYARDVVRVGDSDGDREEEEKREE